MDLREATRDIHHAAEQSPFGQRLVRGAVTPQEWLDLCGAYLEVHCVIDRWCPPYASRTGELMIDVCAAAPLSPTFNASAASWAAHLEYATPAEIAGAHYVLIGAHLMGGSQIRSRLPAGYPCQHLYFRGPFSGHAGAWVKMLRECSALAPFARIAFGQVMKIMAEIEAGK